MKRSCFALSILMASLSGSLLWVDAARSNNGARPSAAISAREATPRPPRVDDDCDAAAESVQDAACVLAETQDDFNCCEESFPAHTCPYDDYDYGCGEVDACLAHPADLPEATIEEESADVVSSTEATGSEECAEMDPRNLSQYDATYDAEVYGRTQETLTGDVENSEELAAEESLDAKLNDYADDYSEETYDYEAYSADSLDAQYAAEADDLQQEMTEDPAAAEVVENAATDPASDYGYEYGYEYEYEYGYGYENAANDTDRAAENEVVAEAASDEQADENLSAAGDDYGYEYDYEYEYEYDSTDVESEAATVAEETPAEENLLTEDPAVAENAATMKDAPAATEAEIIEDSQAAAGADVAETVEAQSAEETAPADNVYEYEYEYEYGYDYEAAPETDPAYDYEYDYDYDYDYESDAYEAPAVDNAAPAGPQADFVESAPSLAPQRSVDFRIVAAHVRDLLENSLNQCEPVRAALDAGVKIVTWSSGIDPALAIQAATAELADLPPGDDASLTR